MSIEETRKKLEKITGLPTIFHWENNGKRGIFSPGHMKFEQNGETRNDDFFGQKWNEAIDKGRKLMEEQASNVNKITSQTETKGKNFHEIKIKLCYFYRKLDCHQCHKKIYEQPWGLDIERERDKSFCSARMCSKLYGRKE